MMLFGPLHPMKGLGRNRMRFACPARAEFGMRNDYPTGWATVVKISRRPLYRKVKMRAGFFTTRVSMSSSLIPFRFISGSTFSRM